MPALPALHAGLWLWRRRLSARVGGAQRLDSEYGSSQSHKWTSPYSLRRRRQWRIRDQ